MANAALWVAPLLPALSLCPAPTVAQRVLKITAQGVGGSCSSIPATHTGSDEGGYYPAWRGDGGVIVAISKAPFPSAASAEQWMRKSIRRDYLRLVG